MLDLVKHNLAVTLLATSAVPADSGVVTVPVAGGPIRVEHLAWSEFNPSPAALAFIALANEQFAATHGVERQR